MLQVLCAFSTMSLGSCAMVFMSLGYCPSVVYEIVFLSYGFKLAKVLWPEVLRALSSM